MAPGHLFVNSQSSIEQIVFQARLAQQEWASRPVKERARLLAKAGKHLMGRADELTQVLHDELGKPLTEAYTVDLGSAPEVFRYNTQQAEKLLASEKVRFNRIMFPKKRAVVERVPHGVVALITPWNYPVSIPLHNLVPALLAGNAVVMKPSEYAPQIGAKLAEILNEKLPPGLLGLVQGDREAGEALIRAGVDHIVFVGGAAGGRAVAKLAADNLIPVSLELGGKDAAIVLEDADLDRAAHGIAWAGLVNAGQSCAAVERVYVVEAVAEAFTAKLVSLVEKLRVGDDVRDPGSIEIGPLANDRQLVTVEAHVSEALEAGAILRCGGKRREPGRYYLPTVLTNVNSSMQIMQSETFGPIIPIQVVPDEVAAIREANATSYGLTGSIWTGDLKRGELWPGNSPSG
jgi:acyl-CoA reductase-like NAD-dependent aldehyde dehydrogenase